VRFWWECQLGRHEEQAMRRQKAKIKMDLTEIKLE
jgi:hypothetical protein